MQAKTVIGWILCDHSGLYAWSGEVRMSGRIPFAVFVPCSPEMQLAQVKLWPLRELAQNAADSLTARKLSSPVLTRVALAVS